MNAKRNLPMLLFSVGWFALVHLLETVGVWWQPTRFVPGWPGDQMMFLWNCGWVDWSLYHGSMGYWCDALFYPRGFFFLFHTHTWLDGAIYALLRGLLPFGAPGAILYYNCLQLFASVVTGVLFLSALRAWGVRRYWIALAAASIMTFTWLRSFSLNGHQNLVGTEWFAAAFCLASWARRFVGARMGRRAIGYSVGAGLALGMAFLNDQTLAVFAALLVVVPFLPWRRGGRRVFRPGLFGICVLASLVVASPHLAAFARYWTRFDRYLLEPGPASTDVVALLLPGKAHFLGGVVGNLPVSDVAFLGIPLLSAIVLAGVLMLVARRRHIPVRRKRDALLMLGCGLAFLLLSLGDSLVVAGHHLFPLPGRLLDHLPVLKFLRAPHRWNLPASVCLATFAVLLLNVRWNSLPRTMRRPVVAGLLLLSVFDWHWVSRPLADFAEPDWIRRDRLVRVLHDLDLQSRSILMLPSEDLPYLEIYQQLAQARFDHPLAVGHCARAPRGAQNRPWQGNVWTPATAGWLRDRRVGVVVLYFEREMGRWSDWIRNAKQAVPDLLILDRDGNRLESE